MLTRLGDERVAKKLHTEEALITAYSSVRLRMDLDRVPLWRGDHVGLKQLWNDYSQYLYLPRLRDSSVLVDVKPEVASRQIADDRARAAEAAGEKMDERSPAGTVDSGGTKPSSLPVEPSKATRFYGRVSLEPVRLLRDMGDVAEAIVQPLTISSISDDEPSAGRSSPAGGSGATVSIGCAFPVRRSNAGPCLRTSTWSPGRYTPSR